MCFLTEHRRSRRYFGWLRILCHVVRATSTQQGGKGIFLLNGAYLFFGYSTGYRRQLYVGVCGRGSLCTAQGIVDPAQLRMDIRPGPCSRGTLTGDSRTSIFIEEKRSGGDVGSSVRALGSRFTYTSCRFGLQEGSAHLALQRSCGGVWSSVRLERHSARINLWYE